MDLRHVPTNQYGVFVKEYKPAGKPLTTMIRLQNGRFYYAPSSEFATI